MSHIFFARELEGVATYWRVLRRDGVTLGFTSHDRALWFDGVLHRAAPGMVPSAIQRRADFSDDSAEVRGVLSHDSISSADLRSGLFDNAAIEIGAVDWETLDRAALYNGRLGAIVEEDGNFNAELESVKARLEVDTIPRTSPTCRAGFCAPGCNLSRSRFIHERTVIAFDTAANSVSFDTLSPADFVQGELRWLDGPQTGLKARILGEENGAFLLDRVLPDSLTIGTRVRLTEGCDHTIATCHGRFGNAVNFQGEPYLPGNDLLARYPVAP